MVLDTVNTASRMESTSERGRIQVTQRTEELLRNEFLLDERGSIQVKGKGQLTTFYLRGRKALLEMDPSMDAYRLTRISTMKRSTATVKTINNDHEITVPNQNSST